MVIPSWPRLKCKRVKYDTNEVDQILLAGVIILYKLNKVYLTLPYHGPKSKLCLGVRCQAKQAR